MKLTQEQLDWIELNKNAALNYLISLDEKDASVNAEIAQTMLFLYGLMIATSTNK